MLLKRPIFHRPLEFQPHDLDRQVADSFKGLVVRFGTDLSGRVNAIRIGDPKFCDHHMEQLLGLSELQIVEILFNKTGHLLTKAAVVQVAKLNRLRSLAVEGDDLITDEVACKISRCKLERLVIPFSNITDTGVAELSRLSEIKLLSLLGTSVTDNCVSDICNLKSLQKVVLERTNITVEGISQIKRSIPTCNVCS